MDAKPSSSGTTSATDDAATEQSAVQAMQAMLVQLTTDGVPKLHCPVCNKALVSLNGYVKHLKKHDPPGGFFCRYCDARYCSEEELKRHRDAVHTTIACRICKDVTFTSEDDYRAHIRDVHNGIDRVMYKCDKCDAEYKTIDPFKRHLETQCGTVKPHKCDQCPMAFVTKYNLKQHKESHTGERKYCCSYCGKNFLQKGRLVEHERSHTGEKPYKCDVCGKCFAHRESIVTHSSIHTGIRLVECKCCLSRFSCYSNLIKHRRTRMETCGLPQYDPPKNRIRTHRSRIPPTLNPTSEIKVSNLNKIIKPDDKEHIKKPIKKESSESKAPRANRGKRPGRPPGRKPGPKSKRKPDTEEEELSETSDNDAHNTNNVTAPKRETRSNVAAQNGLTSAAAATSEAVTSTSLQHTTHWSDSDTEDDYPDFDPPDSESDEDRKQEFSLPTPKLPIKQETPDMGGELEPNAKAMNNFEYSNAAEFISVKSEDDGNIFNEKDKLLDCLLNDEADGVDSVTVERLSFSSSKSTQTSTKDSVKTEESILEETEVIMIKNEDIVDFVEEDILDVKNLSDSDVANCKILLEDVKHRYPELEAETTVKVARNADAYPKRKSKRKNPEKRVKSEAAPDDDVNDDDVNDNDVNDDDVNDDDGDDGDGDDGDDCCSSSGGGGGEPEKRKRRPYRKRRESNEVEQEGPARRLSKLTHQELKSRLKMLKKDGKSWSCPHCIKIYHMRKPFVRHLREDHSLPVEEIHKLCQPEDVGVVNEDIFKCKYCGKIYLMYKRLISHEKLHGPNGDLLFKCPCHCNVYFATKDAATAHAQHEHRKLLFCELCQKFMTGHDSLKNHMRNHHQQGKAETRSSKRNLVCDKCGKKFAGRTSLTDHVRSDCGRKPLYACTVCGKHLTTAGILKTHMLQHKDETPYQCDQCGKTFKVKAQYKTHIKTRHSNLKPYQCHLCPKAYPYRESLLTHMTVHTGIKRFLCNGCGKRFTCISNLQAHRKVHAETCGQLPLNAKATQYMGVQKGNLLLGAKPEAGVDYAETNTLIAKNVLDRDLPMAQELNYPSEPSAPLATVPLNYTQTPAPHLLLPPMLMPQYSADDSHASSYN